MILERFTLAKRIYNDQSKNTLSPDKKGPLSILNIVHNNHNHTIIKSNSCTNNILPLLTIRDKKINQVSYSSFRTSHILNNNHSHNLLKKIKQNYLDNKGINSELMRINNAIKYMFNASKKRNNILKTVKCRKYNLKSNAIDIKTLTESNTKQRDNSMSKGNTKIIQKNHTIKIDTETEEDSFDIPEDERKQFEINFDSFPLTINYPRIIRSPPVMINYVVSPTEQYISSRYKNYRTLQDKILRKKIFHKILQTEPLGIIKEEDEQSDLTKTHTSFNKKKSILINTKSNGNIIDQKLQNHIKLPFHQQLNIAK